MLRINDGEAALMAVEAGLGVVIQSTRNASAALREGRLRAILTNHPLSGGHAIWAIYPATRVGSPKLRATVDIRADRFGGPPEWDAGLELGGAPGE